MKILEFTGKMEFLSLEYPCDIEYKGVKFNNAATLFYALKVEKHDGSLRKMARLSPNKARQKVQPINNPEWDENKGWHLYTALRCKFDQNPELKEQLMKLDGCELINTVKHRDDWIGVRDGRGYNALGRTLENLRDEYNGKFVVDGHDYT